MTSHVTCLTWLRCRYLFRTWCLRLKCFSVLLKDAHPRKATGLDQTFGLRDMGTSFPEHHHSSNANRRPCKDHHYGRSGPMWVFALIKAFKYNRYKGHSRWRAPLASFEGGIFNVSASELVWGMGCQCVWGGRGEEGMCVGEWGVRACLWEEGGSGGGWVCVRGYVCKP